MIHHAPEHFASCDAFVAHARALRSRADTSVREFLDFLRAAEAHEQLWRPHAATYERFLRDTHICDVSRFRQWAQASEQIASATIDKIGVYGATAAVQIADPVKRAEALTEMVAIAQREGTALSEPVARRISQRGRDDYRPAALVKLDKSAAMEVELRRVTSELRKVTKERDALRRESVELRERLDAALNGGGARNVKTPGKGRVSARQSAATVAV